MDAANSSSPDPSTSPRGLSGLGLSEAVGQLETEGGWEVMLSRSDGVTVLVLRVSQKRPHRYRRASWKTQAVVGNG